MIVFTSLLSDILCLALFYFQIGKPLAGFEASYANSSGLELSRGVVIDKTCVTRGPFPCKKRRTHQMADRCKNVFVKIEPKHPDSKNGSSVDENLLDVNFHVGL